MWQHSSAASSHVMFISSLAHFTSSCLWSTCSSTPLCCIWLFYSIILHLMCASLIHRTWDATHAVHQGVDVDHKQLDVKHKQHLNFVVFEIAHKPGNLKHKKCTTHLCDNINEQMCKMERKRQSISILEDISDCCQSTLVTETGHIDKECFRNLTILQ